MNTIKICLYLLKACRKLSVAKDTCKSAMWQINRNKVNKGKMTCNAYILEKVLTPINSRLKIKKALSHPL